MKYPQLVSMPSAVSDWLEQQLEARGIDSVVYTRYVLSLLYRDTVDLLCPEQDFHLYNPNKAERRSGGGRKRFCRSIDADADQLKRTAAVECLKSASDQKCGIESLVDELCEKLKEVKNELNCGSIESTLDEQVDKSNPIKDPAKQYYAAFPALSRNSSSPNLITLIPKWFGSPKKRSPRRQHRSASYEDKLRFKVDSENMKARSTGKQRFSYFSRNKKDYTRMSKSTERPDINYDWEFCNNNNSNFVNDSEQVAIATQEMELDKVEAEDNMYDDLPVDIRDLLDSPPPPNVNIEIMNMANMRDTGSKKFLQYGTNIISSIWSCDVPMEDFDNDADLTEANQLDFKFGSISIDRNVWSSDVKDNETNSLFESKWDFCRQERWSDAEEMDPINSILKLSYSQLNHKREESSFGEIKPRAARCLNFGSILPDIKKVLLDKELTDKEKEDKYYFKPITTNFLETNQSGKFIDGTTFVIPSSWDKINYKMDLDGILYMEDYTNVRKYLDFKKKTNSELTIRFQMKQNDKGCQTDIDNDGNFRMLVSSSSVSDETDFYFPGDSTLLNEEDKCTCVDKFGLNMDHSFGEENCTVHLTRPDSVMAEIFGKFDVKCDKCNNNTADAWNNAWGVNTFVQDKDAKIWGGDICMTCLGLSGRRFLSHEPEQDQLREDITQDGEQLLSDLSSMQKSYMEELPVAEVTCDINELIDMKEWKKEEIVQVASNSLTFASQLEQDCLLKLSTFPSVKSVTL